MWTLSPTIFNQLRFTYVRQFGARVNNPTTSLGDLNSTFKIQGDPTLPRLTVSGYFTGQTSIAGPDAGSNYFSVKDALSMVRGNHSFKFGGEMSYETIVHDTLLDNYGVFSFNGSKTGNAYADFLLGRPATMTQDAPISRSTTPRTWACYAQDDWRVHKHVTLNLGVRYDLQTPLTDPDDRKLTYVQGAHSLVSPTALEGLLFAGDPGIGRGIVYTDKNNVAPRIGIAWDPYGDGKTAVRACADVFYGSVSGNEWNTTADNQPFTVRQRFNSERSLSDVYRQPAWRRRTVPVQLHAGEPAIHAPGAGVRSVARLQMAVHLPDERDDRAGTAARPERARAPTSGALVADKLPCTLDANYPVYGPGRDDCERGQRGVRIQPGSLGSIGVSTPWSTAATTGCRSASRGACHAGSRPRRTTRSARAWKTRVCRTAATSGGAQNSTGSIWSGPGRRRTGRTASRISGVWRARLPEQIRRSCVPLLTNWTVSGIVTLQSGTPLTISSGQDRNFDGLTNDRADIVGDPHLDGWS